MPATWPGQSYRQIATEENIHRTTVTRILSKSDAVHMVARYQARLLQILPKAVLVIEKALDSPDLRVSTGAAYKLMATMSTLYSSGIGLTISEVEGNSWVFEVREKNEMKEEDMAALGRLAELAWKAHSQDQGPLASGWEWLEEATRPKAANEATGGRYARRLPLQGGHEAEEDLLCCQRHLKSPTAEGLNPF